MTEKKESLDNTLQTLEEVIISEFQSSRPPTISFAKCFLFFRRRFLFMVVVTVLGTFLVTGLSFFLPKVYEASVLISCNEPLENYPLLKAGQLPVEFYSAFATSMPVIERTIQEAGNRNIIPQNASLTNENFEARIPVSQLVKKGEKLPLLILCAKANSPEQARDLANLWAEIFLEMAVKDQKDRFNQATNLILSENRENQEKILQIQTSINQIEAEYSELYDTQELKLDHRIRAFQNANPIDFWEKQITQKKQQYLKLEERLFGIEQNIERNTRRIELYRRELEKHPKIYTLARSISDDAFWDNLGKSNPSLSLDFLKDLQLVNEQLNPLHQELLKKLVNAQVELNTLIPFRAFCLKQSSDLKNEITGLGKQVVEKSRELQMLKNEKTISLLTIQNKKDHLLEEAGLQKKSLDAHSDEQAKSAGEAETLKNHVIEDVRISSKAATPFKSVSPNRFYIVLGAFLFFAFVAIISALFLEMRQHSISIQK